MMIRRVDPERYAQTITRLHKACLPEDSMPALEGSWWLTFDGDKAVAFAASRPSYQWGDTTYLSRCGVLASHRGKGLQRRLIRVREKHARAAGKRWLISDTRTNPHSANNLIRAGFTMYEPGSPWSFKDALYWKKRLLNDGKQ
jgi:GNAT superfamily N-acetyltransferase